jgi:hypothetical protein
MREADLTGILRCGQAWRSSLGASPDRFLLDPKIDQRPLHASEVLLTADDLPSRRGPDDLLALIWP